MKSSISLKYYIILVKILQYILENDSEICIIVYICYKRNIVYIYSKYKSKY